MSQRIGLGVVQMVANHIDKLPDKYFRPEEWIGGKNNKKKDKHSSRRSSDRGRSHSHHKSRRNSTAFAGAAGAGVGAAAANDYDERRRRRRSEDDQRYSDDSSDDGRYHSPRNNDWQYPRQRAASQAYQQQDLPRAQSQGDPNFPYNGVSYQNGHQSYYPPDQTGFHPTYEPSQQGDPNFGQTQQGTQSSTMADGYYPPQSQQSGSSGYHRYNPADYQPRDSDSPSGRGQGDRYQQSARNQLDPYKKPSSNGYHGQQGYDDDYSDYDSDRDDDRRGRGKDNEKRKSKKSRSPSPGNPLLDGIHKHLDASQKGLAAGAIGAIAGGLLGHKFGKSPLVTAAGVVIGGVGANAWEAREERHKEEQHKRDKGKVMALRARSEAPSSKGHRDDSYDRDAKRGSTRDDDVSSDDYDSEEEYRRRKQEKRSQRSSRRDDYDD